MKFFKSNFKYIFIFLFSFFSMSFLLTYFDGDVLWNYGFAYAISQGEIPYLDFNMILTPFYPMIMSLILRLNSNIFFFYLENCFLITAIFSLLFKKFNSKAWLFLVFLIFPIPAVIFPSYNLFLLFLLILIIYLEENNKSDLLIGFLIGVSILTKQTVGCALVLPSILYYFKDKKKIIKRLLCVILPCFAFFVYLILNNNLYSFIDLCFLGLFDFTAKNSNINFVLIIGLILIVYSVYLFFKNRKQIKYFYILCFATIMVPLFDYPHIEYFFFAFMYLFVDKIKLSNKQIIFNSILFSSVFSLMFFILTVFQGKIDYPNHYQNFNFRLLYNRNEENYIRNQIIKYINMNKERDIVFLATDAYFYKITLNMKITKFDLINKGNNGYNGTNKIKKELAKMKKGTIFIIDTNETFSKRSSIQFDREIAKYGIKLGKKITCIGGYTIYEKI